MSELQCVHEVGHKVETHGCDGCCLEFSRAAEERIIEILDNKCWCDVGLRCGAHNLIEAIRKETNEH